MTFLLYFHTTKLMVLSFIVHSYKTTYEKNRVGRRLVWAAALWKEKKIQRFFFERSEINLTKISLQSFPNSEKITDSCVIELLKLSPKKEFEKEIQKENYFEIRKKVEKSETKKALITG